MAYAFFFFFEAVTILVVVCSAGRLVFNITSLVPVSIDYQKNKKKKRDEKLRKVKNCCSRTSRFFRNCISRTKTIEGDWEDDTNYVKAVYLNYSDSGRVYCRYCRAYMTHNGDISDYFDLFVHYRLDEDDVKLMKRLLHGTGLCPKCYRPYKIFPDESTDRLNRLELQLEIIRYVDML